MNPSSATFLARSSGQPLASPGTRRLPRHGFHLCLILPCLAALSVPLQAAPLYWDGPSGTNWNDVAAWSTDPSSADPLNDPASPPGSADVATFSSTTLAAEQVVLLTTPQSVLGLATNVGNAFLTTLRADGTPQTLTIGVSGISHTGGGLVLGSATAGQELNISLGGGQFWTSSATGTGAAGLQVLNNVSSGVAGAVTLTLAGINDAANGSAARISGNISDGVGTLGITKSNPGTWILSGNNSYTGVTTITGGTLNIQSSTALGSATAGTTIQSGASLHLQGDITVTGETLSFSGDGVGGVGALRNISGNNTWTGNITITEGSANNRIASDAGRLTITGDIALSTAANQQLVLQGAGAGTISGIISGNNNVTRSVSGTGAWTLSGANTYTGLTTISSGTISASNIVVTDGASNLGNATSRVILGSSSGTTAAGILSYTGSSVSYVRGFSVLNTGGTLTVTNASTVLTLDSVGVAIAANGLFTVNGAGNTVINAAITQSSGTGGRLTKSGSGTLTLNTANTYTGVTTVSSGALRVLNAGALGTTDTGTSVGAGGGLWLEGGVAVLGESLSLTGDGIGTGVTAINGALRSVSGNNSWSGNITVGSAGTTRVVVETGSELTLGGSVALTTDATQQFVLQGNGNGYITGDISGAGRLTRSTTGTGIWRLSGNNTYTGLTTVSGGGLLVNGTHTNAGAYSSAALVGGTGSVTGASGAGFSVSSAGTLRVGDTHGAGGTAQDFSVGLSGTGGNVVVSGFIEIDLFGNNNGLNPSSNNDVLVLNATEINLTGSTLRVSNQTGISSLDWLAGSTWKLIDWNVLPAGRPSLANLMADIQLAAGHSWSSYSDTTGFYITVVPEPSRAVLLFSALAVVALRRRRRLA